MKDGLIEGDVGMARLVGRVNQARGFLNLPPPVVNTSITECSGLMERAVATMAEMKLVKIEQGDSVIAGEGGQLQEASQPSTDELFDRGVARAKELVRTKLGGDEGVARVFGGTGIDSGSILAVQLALTGQASRLIEAEKAEMIVRLQSKMAEAPVTTDGDQLRSELGQPGDFLSQKIEVAEDVV